MPALNTRSPGVTASPTPPNPAPNPTIPGSIIGSDFCFKYHLPFFSCLLGILTLAKAVSALESRGKLWKALLPVWVTDQNQERGISSGQKSLFPFVVSVNTGIPHLTLTAELRLEIHPSPEPPKIGSEVKPTCYRG